MYYILHHNLITQSEDSYMQLLVSIMLSQSLCLLVLSPLFFFLRALHRWSARAALAPRSPQCAAKWLMWQLSERSKSNLNEPEIRGYIYNSASSACRRLNCYLWPHLNMPCFKKNHSLVYVNYFLPLCGTEASSWLNEPVVILSESNVSGEQIMLLITPLWRGLGCGGGCVGVCGVSGGQAEPGSP